MDPPCQAPCYFSTRHGIALFPSGFWALTCPQNTVWPGVNHVPEGARQQQVM